MIFIFSLLQRVSIRVALKILYVYLKKKRVRDWRRFLRVGGALSVCIIYFPTETSPSFSNVSALSLVKCARLATKLILLHLRPLEI